MTDVPLNFIDQFVHATRHMAAPEIFRRWCALSVVSAAMSRRVWTCIEEDLKLFPNLYVMLVSKPGIGKSRPMEMAKKLLLALDPGGAFLAFMPDELTRQQMIKHMGEWFMPMKPDGEPTYVSLISEFACFMPEPDAGWMQACARLWDCPDFYERATKHCGHDTLYRPYVTMLAGVQPAWFSEGFPANSYEMGLPARMFFIHADVKPHRRFFGTGKQVDGFDNLVKKLERIHAVAGHIPWTPEAQAGWREWCEDGMPPEIGDPFLEGYVVRRDMHTSKMALICAVATHPGNPQIKLSDLEQAWVYLREAELTMPKALIAAGGNIYKRHEEKVIDFVRKMWSDTKKHVPESEVRRRLGQTVPTPMIRAIIDELIAQKRLVELATAEKAPYRLLKPGKEKTYD